MHELILIPFVTGTLAFFATVFLAIQDYQVAEASDEGGQQTGEHPLRKWDTVITWFMWGGWGCAAVLLLLDRAEMLDMLGL